MVLYGLVSLVLLVYAVVDLTTTPSAAMRTLPKPLWYFVVLVVPLVGPVAWLLAGRPKRSGRSSAPPARQVAPDDDEEFLRELRRRQADPRDDAA